MAAISTCPSVAARRSTAAGSVPASRAQRTGAVARLGAAARPAAAAAGLRRPRRAYIAPRADVNADAFGAPRMRAPAASDAASRAREPSVRQFDFVVVGSGIAGLSYALKVAPYGKVAVITKDGASEGCTRYAQGGVCAVLDPLDSIEKHARDTMVAGAFLNDPK
jgi:L-aspartate oxidase